MTWKRLGLVFAPGGSKPWARSHAALPTPAQVGPDLFRFFFSARDGEQRSHLGWVDVDLSGSPKVVAEAAQPILSPGPDGAFDDSGVGIGSLVASDDGVRLYYMGWNLGIRTPWRNAIGLAIAPRPGDPFVRFSPGPILDRSPEDAYSLSYPWVIRRSPQDWWMWYGSNLVPHAGKADMQHAVKAARSRDGVRWERDGKVVVGFATPGEYAIARPTVAEVAGRLLMCFACRGERYRIGAAWSADGVNWTRDDETMGLKPSERGWDSEMTCYPALFWHAGRLWLAYNGNGYGLTGLGLALWQGDDLPT